MENPLCNTGNLIKPQRMFNCPTLGVQFMTVPNVAIKKYDINDRLKENGCRAPVFSIFSP